MGIRMIRTLPHIVSELKREEFILTRHAFARSVERGIEIDEIIDAADNIEIIEEYPDDKFSPSCLVLGFTKHNRPLHIQVTLDTSNIMKIITLYEPDIIFWINNYKTRI